MSNRDEFTPEFAIDSDDEGESSYPPSSAVDASSSPFPSSSSSSSIPPPSALGVEDTPFPGEGQFLERGTDVKTEGEDSSSSSSTPFNAPSSSSAHNVGTPFSGEEQFSSRETDGKNDDHSFSTPFPTSTSSAAHESTPFPDEEEFSKKRVEEQRVSETRKEENSSNSKAPWDEDPFWNAAEEDQKEGVVNAEKEVVEEQAPNKKEEPVKHTQEDVQPKQEPASSKKKKKKNQRQKQEQAKQEQVQQQQEKREEKKEEEKEEPVAQQKQEDTQQRQDEEKKEESVVSKPEHAQQTSTQAQTKKKKQPKGAKAEQEPARQEEKPNIQEEKPMEQEKPAQQDKSAQSSKPSKQDKKSSLQEKPATVEKPVVEKSAAQPDKSSTQEKKSNQQEKPAVKEKPAAEEKPPAPHEEAVQAQSAQKAVAVQQQAPAPIEVQPTPVPQQASAPSSEQDPLSFLEGKEEDASDVRDPNSHRSPLKQRHSLTNPSPADATEDRAQKQAPVAQERAPKASAQKQEQSSAATTGEKKPAPEKPKKPKAKGAPTMKEPASKAPAWVPDSASKDCTACKKPFTLFNRRHHCRRCGGLFCNDCCGLVTSLPPEFGQKTRSRVCSTCFRKTLKERLLQPNVVTIDDGGPSKETKVVSSMMKMFYWKMGAYEGASFDRSIVDSVENSTSVIPVQQVQDLMIEREDAVGYRMRIYHPDAPGHLPIMVWCHTGHFCTRNIESPSVDGLCRLLANHINCIIISVDYRMAPEHKFPAAAEDCFSALMWAFKNAHKIRGDPSRLAIGGDGAGANLAAAAALLARDRNALPPNTLKCQVLITPPLDLTAEASTKYPSRGILKDAYVVPAPQFKWFAEQYLGKDKGESPYASPLLAPSHEGLPPAFVVTAGYDPFHSEGEMYAHKLRSAGVDVMYAKYSNSVHGFFGSGLDESDEAMMHVVLYISVKFRGSTPSPSPKGSM